MASNNRDVIIAGHHDNGYKDTEIYCSNDIVNWKTIFSGTDIAKDPLFIQYSGGRFVVSGTNFARLSDDGKDWDELLSMNYEKFIYRVYEIHLNQLVAVGEYIILTGRTYLIEKIIFNGGRIEVYFQVMDI